MKSDPLVLSFKLAKPSADLRFCSNYLNGFELIIKILLNTKLVNNWKFVLFL